MRKITKQSVSAFLAKIPFKMDNTEVIINESGKNAMLLLHGHPIAERVGEKRLYIDSCGWLTNTTKERLNGLPGVSISQKSGKWYLNGEIWDGTRKLVSSDYYMLH